MIIIFHGFLFLVQIVLSYLKLRARIYHTWKIAVNKLVFPRVLLTPKIRYYYAVYQNKVMFDHVLEGRLIVTSKRPRLL